MRKPSADWTKRKFWWNSELFVTEYILIQRPYTELLREQIVKLTKDENKLKPFIDSAIHYETEDTLSYIIENELVKRDLLFKKGPHKGLTPVGKIIYHYRKIFLNN